SVPGRSGVPRPVIAVVGSQPDSDVEQQGAAEVVPQKIRCIRMREQHASEARADQRQRTPALAQIFGWWREMAVAVEYGAFEADEGDQVEFAQINAPFAVVVRLLAQGRCQARLHLAGRDTLGTCLAAHQLTQREGTAAALKLGAPLIVEASPLVEHEKYLEAGVAKQYVRRFLAAGSEVVLIVTYVQRLQQTLADPTLALPFPRIGEEGVGLFGLVRQKA